MVGMVDHTPSGLLSFHGDGVNGGYCHKSNYRPLVVHVYNRFTSHHYFFLSRDKYGCLYLVKPHIYSGKEEYTVLYSQRGVVYHDRSHASSPVIFGG